MHAGASAPSSTPDTSSHSRGAFRPSFALRFTPPKQRAQGRPGAGWHPRSAARKCSARRPHSSIQVTPNTRPSLRDGRTAYAALSREPNSFWPPSPCGRYRHRAGWRQCRIRKELDRSDDGRDHTVLPYAGRSGFARRLRRTRRRSYNAACETLTGVGSIHRPALRSHPRRRCPRPPQPDPRLVTTYDRPFSPDQDGRNIRQIRISVKWNIFG